MSVLVVLKSRVLECVFHWPMRGYHVQSRVFLRYNDIYDVVFIYASSGGILLFLVFILFFLAFGLRI
jgi:hypothetical protein